MYGYGDVRLFDLHTVQFLSGTVGLRLESKLPTPNLCAGFKLKYNRMYVIELFRRIAWLMNGPTSLRIDQSYNLSRY
jgi:hypothetical protein